MKACQVGLKARQPCKRAFHVFETEGTGSNSRLCGVWNEFSEDDIFILKWK